MREAFDEKNVAISTHLERAGYRFAREYSFDSFSTVKRLAARGMGIAILPLRLAEEDLKNKSIRPISLKGFPSGGFGHHSICATVRSEDRKDPRLKRFVTLLKKHFD